VISAAAQNKQGNTTPYTQLGTLTVEGSGNLQKTFTLSVSPDGHTAAAGTSVNYTVTVSDQNGFNEPVTLNASAMTQYSTGLGGQKLGADGDPSQLSFAFNPATLTTSGTSTLTVTSTSSAPPANYAITVTGVAQTEEHSATGYLEIENAPPQLTLSPTSGTGSSATFTITWDDYVNVPAGINFLVAPSLDGSHACWIYFKNNGPSAEIYLASDDGLSWTDAYRVTDPFIGPATGPGASNSQCGFASPPSWNTDRFVVHNGVNTLTIPLTFTPAFNGTKTVYLRGITTTGFDTGYQPKGGWTVQ
jgi:hypothetical protein